MMDAIDRAFIDERRFIAGCADVRVLLDRMADYREDRRAAVAHGVTKGRQRADDLLELAEDRIGELKAEGLREKARRAKAESECALAPAVSPASPPRRQVVQPSTPGRPNRTVAQPAPARSREADETDRRLKRLEAELEEARAANRKAKRERAAAEEREQAALQKAKRRARANAAAPNERKTPVGTVAAAASEREVAPVAAAARADHAPSISSAAPTVPDAASPPTAGVPAPPMRLDEDPLFADLFARPVRPPPVPLSPGVVYTGGDLAQYRAEVGLTQRLAAHQFGVAHGTIAKAEMDPTKVLGEQLQTGMRNVRAR